MIIKKLQFRNFKSFSNDVKYQTIDKLDILNIIYGENNSGKSNLLKFINILFKSKLELSNSLTVNGQSLSRPSDKTAFWKGRISNDAFLFHKNNRLINISFEVTLAFMLNEISQLESSKLLITELEILENFFDVQIRGSICSMSDPYDSEIILESVFINRKNIYKIKDGIPIVFESAISVLKNDSVTFENLMGILSDCVLFLDHNRFLNSENENSSDNSLTPSNFKNWLYNLTLDPFKYSKYQEFIDFVKSNSITGNSGKVLANFEPTFSRVGEQIDILLKSNQDRLPIGSFGTGITQILLILALIFETKAKIVLIEELELNLSPNTQQELLRILGRLIQNKYIDQIIFTSHSQFLSQTNGLIIYEVSLSEQGISKIIYKTNPSKGFFKRKTALNNQIATTLRTNSKRGLEWE